MAAVLTHRDLLYRGFRGCFGVTTAVKNNIPSIQPLDHIIFLPPHIQTLLELYIMIWSIIND